MKRSLAIALLITALVITPSEADQSRRHDPNDTPGPLDIRVMSHGHTGGNMLWHKVVMRARWRKGDLRGNNEIRFQFSTDREDRFDEVNASIDLQDGKLRAWIYPYVEGSGYTDVGSSERIRFVRPNRHSIKIFFDRSWVDRRDRYVWSVSSRYKRERSPCKSICYDYAPGRTPDRLEHNL